MKQGGTRVVLFELSRYLQVKQVEYEGKPLEFIQNEAIEGSELSRRGNDTIAVVFPAPLQPGSTFRCDSPMPARCCRMPVADCFTSARAEPGIPIAASPWPITISPSVSRSPGH